MKNQNQKSQQQFNIEQINAQYGKLPPQAVDVEEAVLGAIMLERDAIHKISPIISTEAFYKEEHQKIFESVSLLAAGNHSIDLLTVVQYLKDNEMLDAVGGPGYITGLTSRVSSAAHIEQHARIISDKFFQREIIRFSTELQTAAYADNIDELQMLYTAKSQAIDNLMAGSTGMMHIREVLKRAAEDLEERQKKAQNNETPGITTGLVDFDRINSGWQPGELIVVAARPAMGKTAIALNLFTKAPAISGKSVCVFSLEMENIKLSERLILSYGGIERDNLRSGRMNDDDWKAYNQASGQLEQLPIYIDDTAATTVKYIDAVSRNKARKGQCDLIVIDYLQLVESPTGFGNKNREREVAEISRGLKKTAKALGIPVILLAQLNRALENREDKKPKMADIRESGAIEQDADIIIFPWRPCYYEPEATTDNGMSLKNIMFLEVAKYRDGKTTTILAKHNDDLTEFYDFNILNQQDPNAWMGDK